MSRGYYGTGPQPAPSPNRNQPNPNRGRLGRAAKSCGLIALGVAVLGGGGGWALAEYLNSDISNSHADKEPRHTPTPEASPTTTPEDLAPAPARSSGDDQDDPHYGWTQDPTPTASKESIKPRSTATTDPCTWGKSATGNLVVRGYDECTDDLREAMVAYAKPDTSSEHRFGLSNEMEVRDDGCQITGSRWILAHVVGINGDARGFIQDSVLGHPKLPACPPNYQEIANGHSG